MLTGCRGHAAVLWSSCFPGWRFPTSCHTRRARVQLLSRIGPFDCSWGMVLCARTLSWCHVYMLPCCHWDTSRRTTRGQKEDNRGQQVDKKRTTTRRQQADIGFTRGPAGHQQTPAEGEQEDKRRTRTTSGDRLAAGQDAHQKKDKKRTSGGQRPDTAFTHAQRLWPASLFLRENPNSKLFGETRVQKAMGRLEQQTSAPFVECPMPKLLH